MINFIYFVNTRKFKKISNIEADNLLKEYDFVHINVEECAKSDGKINKILFDIKNSVYLINAKEEIIDDYILNDLRQKRLNECFLVINRGKLWYDNLTQEQLEELNKWYQEWLNVTETLVEPITPEWIK